MLALAAEILVFGIICGTMLGVAVFRYLHACPLLNGDFAKHFESAASLHAALASAPSLWDRMATVAGWSVDYPPLPYLWTSMVFSWTGLGEASAHLGQMLWLVVLLAAVYLCMRPRWGRTLACLGTLLCGSSIVIAEATSYYTPDLAVAATSFVALCLLAQAHDFESSPWSLALGLAAGTSLLCKWSAAFYLALPAAVLLGRCFWRAGWRARGKFVLLLAILAGGAVGIYFSARGGPMAPVVWTLVLGVQLMFVSGRMLRGPAERPLGNAFRALVVACGLCAGYYVHALSQLLGRLDHHHRDTVFATWETLRSLLGDLAASAMFGLPLLLPIGLLLVLTLRNRDPLPRVLCLALLGGLAFTILARLIAPRYYAPLIPVVVILGIFWLAQARPWIRVPVVALLAVAGLAQSALLTLEFPGIQVRPLLAAMYFRPYSDFAIQFRHFNGPSCQEEPLLRARLDCLVEQLGRRIPSGPSVVTVVHDFENPDSLLYAAETLQVLSLVQGQGMVFQEFMYDGKTLQPRLHMRDALWTMLRLAERFPDRKYTVAHVPDDALLVLGGPKDLQATVTATEHAVGGNWRLSGIFAMPGSQRAVILVPKARSPRPDPPGSEAAPPPSAPPVPSG